MSRQMTFDEVTEMEFIGSGGGVWQYAVIWGRFFNEDGRIHRGPYDSLGEAQDWIESAEGDGFTPGVFKVVRRRVGEWEHAE